MKKINFDAYVPATYKNKYFYCNEDNFGQRSGNYTSVYLTEKQIEVKSGFKYYGDHFLYESEAEIIRVCQY